MAASSLVHIPTKAPKYLSSALLAALFLSGCTNHPATDKVAESKDFQKRYVQTKQFKLATYQRLKSTHSELTVYIEGDGSVLDRRGRVSKDPTPKSTTLLQMAAIDKSPNLVYLARPCQNSPEDLDTVCEAKHWTRARYSQEIVDSLNQALTKLKIQTKSDKINLIGYSGGGGLVVLIAATRDDIKSIRTVAGNLDLITMDKHHQSNPLTESLDPLQVASKVSHIPQLHFVGTLDNIVPVEVARNFQARANLSDRQIIELPKNTHSNGWIENWAELLEYIP